MDSILADIRKYGFSLVTLLLTATALVPTANPAADRVAASSVIIVLVLVLFLMDRYWWVLLRSAVGRALDLEQGLGIEISSKLSKVAQASHNTQAASLIYATFLLVSGGVALVSVLPSGQSASLWVTIIITIVAVFAVAILHCVIEARLQPEAKWQSPPVPGE